MCRFSKALIYSTCRLCLCVFWFFISSRWTSLAFKVGISIKHKLKNWSGQLNPGCECPGFEGWRRFSVLCNSWSARETQRAGKVKPTAGDHWRRCAKATRVQFGAAGEDFIRVPDFQRFPSPEVLKLALYLILVKLPLLLTNYLCSWARRGRLRLRKKLGKERKENMWWKCWNYVLKSRTVSKKGTMILFWCRWLIFFSSTAFTVVLGKMSFELLCHF